MISLEIKSDVNNMDNRIGYMKYNLRKASNRINQIRDEFKKSQSGGAYTSLTGLNLTELRPVVGGGIRKKYSGGATAKDVEAKCTACQQAEKAFQKAESKQSEVALYEQASAKCEAAEVAAKSAIAKIKAEAEVQLQENIKASELSESKIVKEQCEAKADLIKNEMNKQIDAKVAEYRAELEKNGIPASNDEVIISEPTQNAEAIVSESPADTNTANAALSKIAGLPVKIIYVDKPLGNENLATLGASSTAATPVSATGATVFSGGKLNKLYVHDRKTHRTYSAGTKSVSGRKLIDKLIKRLNLRNLNQLSSKYIQNGGHILFPKDGILFLSKGGGTNDLANHVAYQTQGGSKKSNKKSNRKSNKKANRKSNRKSNKKSNRK